MRVTLAKEVSQKKCRYWCESFDNQTLTAKTDDVGKLLEASICQRKFRPEDWVLFT